MQIGIDGSLMSRVHLLTCVLVALGTHYVFGWQFSILGAFVAGYLATNHPIRSGMLTMVISWGVLIVYNIAVAPTENAEMLRVMGVILGDLPAFVPVAITLAIGALMGAAGGWAGAKPNTSRTSRQSTNQS